MDVKEILKHVDHTIFFIGSGIIEAIDYRVYGTPYDFM